MTSEIDGLQELLKQVTDNPAKIVFPTDRWGFTSKIKKEILYAASQVKGQTDKHDLLLGTLVLLITHIKLRKDKDVKERKLHMERLEAAHKERLPREQFSARPKG